MKKLEKLLKQILIGNSDKNIKFTDFLWLLKKLDFD